MTAEGDVEYTLDEALEYLQQQGVNVSSKQTMYNWNTRGVLRPTRRLRQRTFYLQSVLDQFVRDNTVELK